MRSALSRWPARSGPAPRPHVTLAHTGDGHAVNSNIDPPADVARVVRMAQDHHILVQYGATGGGNDGAAYTRYGTADVALGWPMVYSHSPVEAASLHDVAGLSG